MWGDKLGGFVSDSENKPGWDSNATIGCLVVVALLGGLVWIAFAIFGGGGDDGESETAAETTSEDFDYAQDIGALDITVDELPAKWNAAVEAYGLGNPLPETVEGTDDGVGGLNAFYETDNGNYVSISWSPETSEVVGIEVGGFTADSNQATSIIANAAAMTHATSTLTPAEAETLIIDDLVGTSLDTATADDLISEIVELDDRAYRFSLAGNSATFSVDATG